MASKFLLVFLLVFCSGVNSATLLEKGYDYFVSLGKSFAPNLLSIFECMSNEDSWGCAREKAGKMLDGWEEDVEKERRSWEGKYIFYFILYRYFSLNIFWRLYLIILKFLCI